MWTYTGTVAFSAPEIFSGNVYTYRFSIKLLKKKKFIVNKWICGVQAAYYTLCCLGNCHLIKFI